MRRHQ
jgi:hypothetical protein